MWKAKRSLLHAWVGLNTWLKISIMNPIIKKNAVNTIPIHTAANDLRMKLISVPAALRHQGKRTVTS
jgi:hypothetical protein